jgi:hypothetical protein
MLSRIKHDPIDWSAIVTDLVRGGFSFPAISARIGIPPSTVKAWRNPPYSEPHHSSGERLIILWCNATLKDRHQLPTKDRPTKPTVFRRTTWVQLQLIEGQDQQTR